MLLLEVSDMTLQNRCFHYEKCIVINALYDTVEALGLSLDSSNSMRGTLIVSDAEHIGKMRIALSIGVNANQTQVEFIPAEDSNAIFVEKWSPVILDELAGRIKRLHQFKRGEITK